MDASDAGVDVDADVDVDVDAVASVDVDVDASVDAVASVDAGVDADASVDAAADVDVDVAGGCFDGASVGHRRVTCGDIVYDVEVPAACAVRGACGLIVDIHGWTMTADLEDKNTLMRARGRDAGFVVVQPTAPGYFGVPTWDMARDAEPIFAFVSEVAADLGTDPDRAHVMGFSQGGGLTWQLVCRHADFFASAAPLAALPGCAFAGADVPSAEVDVMVVHGRLDTVVNITQMDGQRDAALGYWPFGAQAELESDADHDAYRWTTPSGTTLEVWEHDYTAVSLLLNGHCVPGSPDVVALPMAFGCQQADAFDYAGRALAFFQAHPR